MSNLFHECWILPFTVVTTYESKLRAARTTIVFKNLGEGFKEERDVFSRIDSTDVTN
jgi:hypothetical protein